MNVRGGFDISENALGSSEAIQADIAESLANQYAVIYYVDTDDDSYVEFSSTDVYKDLGVEPVGPDFFEATRRNVLRNIHPDDLDLLETISDKRALLKALHEDGMYTVTYRLVMPSETMWARLLAVMSRDRRHIVIGVSNVNEQIRLERAVAHAEERSTTYSHIALSLAKRYGVLYHVDTQTGEYRVYSTSEQFRKLQSESKGADFFAALNLRAPDTVHPDDIDLLLDFTEPARLNTTINEKEQANVTYRLKIEGNYIYVRMHAVRTEDHRHFIIGISDVDAEIKAEIAAKEAEERSRVFGNIAKSLANHYATIYFVDVYTKHYTEFTSSDMYKALEVDPTGEDFFESSRENIVRVVHPEDVDSLVSLMDRDRMTEIINREGSATATYRLMLGGEPVYTNMNCVWADDRRHIIVGVSDVDAQVKRELAQKEVEERSRVYGYIAQSLAHQYATIYYVDVYTESYVEFSSNDMYNQLQVPPAGDDFFNESCHNILRVVHPDDSARLIEIMDREAMTAAINEHGSVSITYRLKMGDDWAYTTMRAVWADDMRHLIIGVSDVDAIMRRELAQKEAEERTITYAHIAQSLANRYDSIYYVDMATGEYTEYISTEEYKNLNIKERGSDFFKETRRNITNLVYEEDKSFALEALEKQNLLDELDKSQRYSVNYRLMINGEPRYVNISAVWADDMRHIIVGIANVDDEVRRDIEHANNLRIAHERAIRDELCGVRNKNGYQEMEAEIQEEIRAGNPLPFGLVICDVNGLKDVNDTQGHKAGDAYIKSACSLICNVYAHSPVFRIGGDEFAVVLRGKDLIDRDQLLKHIRGIVLKNQEEGGAIVATGMSVFNEDADASVSDVFKRADEAMYANKRTLKGTRD